MYVHLAGGGAGHSHLDSENDCLLHLSTGTSQRHQRGPQGGADPLAWLQSGHLRLYLKFKDTTEERLQVPGLGRTSSRDI